MLCSIATKII